MMTGHRLRRDGKGKDNIYRDVIIRVTDIDEKLEEHRDGREKEE